MQQQLIAFATLAVLLAMLPGIDTAQILRSVTRHGPKTAYATLLGIMAGVWVWGAAAAVGVSALLLTSAHLFRGFLIVSSAYLFYLGIKMLIDSGNLHSELSIGSPNSKTGWREFLRAFTVTFSNPKNGAFYVAVLPQFLPHNMPALAGGLLLATIHNAICFIWFSAMIWGTGFARDFINRPNVQVIIERISGLALIGFGVRMALEAKQ